MLQTKSENCLERSTIRDYLDGNVHDEQLDPIHEHLESCSSCDAIATELESESDWLVRHVRAAGGDPSADHSPEWVATVRARFSDQEIGGEANGEALGVRSHVSDVQSDSPGADSQREIGAYQLNGILGRGGMGSVYAATHRHLHTDVAIKVVDIHGREAEARFDREMQTLAAIQHSSIVRVTDAGVSNGSTYYVMERIHGADLGRVLKKYGPLEIADAAEIIRQAALGIDAAHADHVVHRDIKPSNIMLASDGQIKVLDFGLAKTFSAPANISLATSMGQLLGTLDYLAPEQAGVGAIDHCADIYSLGATLFVLLTGVPPLGRASDTTVLQHLQNLANEKARPIDALRPGVPSELTDVIARTLARDPANRPATARELAELLEPFCEGSNLTRLIAEVGIDEPLPLKDAESSRNLQNITADHVTSASNGLPGGGSEDHWSEGPTVADQTVQSRTAVWSDSFRLFWRLIAALALASAGAVAGIAIYLQTGEGTLRIETHGEDIKVRIRRVNEDAGQSIHVEDEGKSLQLRSGVYAITLDGARGDIELSSREFRIMRGESAVVTVRYARQDPSVSAATGEGDRRSVLGGGGGATAVEAVMGDAPENTLLRLLADPRITATYRDRRAVEWVSVLRNELDYPRRRTAAISLLHLVPRVPRNLQGRLVLEVTDVMVDHGLKGAEFNVAHFLQTTPGLWGDAVEASGSVGHLAVVGGYYQDYPKHITESLQQLTTDEVGDLLEYALEIDDSAGELAVVLSEILRRALVENDAEAEARYVEVLDSADRPVPEIARLVTDWTDASSLPTVTARMQDQAPMPSELRMLMLAMCHRRIAEPSEEFLLKQLALVIATDNNGLALAVHIWGRHVWEGRRPDWQEGLVLPIVDRLEEIIEDGQFAQRIASGDLELTSRLDVVATLLHEPTISESKRLLLSRFCGNAFDSLVSFRDAGGFPEKEEYRYDRLYPYAVQLLENCIVFGGGIPAGAMKEPSGEGLIGHWWKDLQLRKDQQTNRPKIQSTALASLFPFQVVASSLQTAKFGATPTDQGLQPCLPAELGFEMDVVTLVAAVSQVAGMDDTADAAIAEEWDFVGSSVNALALFKRSPLHRECERIHQSGLDVDEYLLKIARNTSSKRLAMAALVATSDSASIDSELIEAALEVEETADLLGLLQWLESRKETAPYQQRIAKALTRDGFDKKASEETWFDTRLVFLETVDAEHVAEHLGDLVKLLSTESGNGFREVATIEGMRLRRRRLETLLRLVNGLSSEQIAKHRSSLERTYCMQSLRWRETVSSDNVYGELQKLGRHLGKTVPKVRGEIVKMIALNEGQMLLSVGSDDGIQQRQMLSVYRNGKWVAFAVVNNVASDAATISNFGEFESLPGDDVYPIGQGPDYAEKDGS